MTGSSNQFSQVSGDRTTGQSDTETLGLGLLTSDDRGQWFDTGFTWITRLLAFCTVATLFWMAWLIFRQAWPAIQEFGLAFLGSKNWDIGLLEFGALPYISGTLITSTIALMLAFPIGLAVALVTSENFLPGWVRSPLAFVVELIAAIPSVIIGFWGIFVFLDAMLPMNYWLYENFGWLPLFSTEPFGPGILPAGVILAIMILPTMAAISREVLLAVPVELRSASGSLGATRWETIFRVILPTAMSGILGAATLALGRALGETMAVTMVIGNSPFLTVSLLDLGATIPSVLANEFAEALDPLHIGALMYLALVLFVITLIVNIAAVVLVRVFSAPRL
jgi:phosphate transport system permease protein